LLLADSYLGLKDAYQARATLRSLIDNFPLDDVKSAASSKLKKMDEEELKKKESAKPDSVNDKN
jgi:hypothetical protein